MDAKDIRNLQKAYLEVYQEIDEGAAQKVADRAQKLANQRKGQTPQRKATYQSLANNADERANPKPEKNYRLGMSDDFRKLRALAKETEGGDKLKTTNPKKLRKQKAMGELGEQVDIYDIILSHLLDEGFAETPEAAEAIMVNMSEEWKQSIVEGGFNSSGRYDVGGGRTVGPVAGAVRSLFSGNLPKGQTYVPPTKQTGPNRPPAVPASKDDSGKLTDFGAGGGKAKLKTGMSVGQVERQGRMNKGDYSG